MTKLAPWSDAPRGALYHWCPACEQLHVIPVEGWTQSGTDERPTFMPSFGQTTKRGRCHYNITNGTLFFHGDCYHTMRGTVELPDIPPSALGHLNDTDGVTSEAVFER